MKPRLALPFALIAAAPFVALARPWSAIVAALAMGVAGAVVRPGSGWRALGCATVVAGGVGGLFAGSFAWGVLLGAMAVFPLRLVSWAAEGGIARRGSVLDAVDVRQAWAVAAVLVTVVPAPLLSFEDLRGLPLLIGFGTIVLFFVVLADLAAFLRLGALERAAKRGQAAPLSAVPRDVPLTDVGIGERQHEERAPGAPYRGVEEILSVVRGDAGEARRRLYLRLMLDLSLAALAALLFAVATGALRIDGLA
jgi:hypothetical protein